MKIAIGGIKHETNTFSPLWTELSDFRITQGQDVLNAEMRELGKDAGVEVFPTFVARATPGGLVRKNTFVRLKHDLLKQLREHVPLDGVYLDLHGAMEVEGIGDGEGELVCDMRRLVGSAALISASLRFVSSINFFISSVACATRS